MKFNQGTQKRMSIESGQGETIILVTINNKNGADDKGKQLVIEYGFNE